MKKILELLWQINFPILNHQNTSFVGKFCLESATEGIWNAMVLSNIGIRIESYIGIKIESPIFEIETITLLEIDRNFCWLQNYINTLFHNYLCRVSSQYKIASFSKIWKFVIFSWVYFNEYSYTKEEKQKHMWKLFVRMRSHHTNEFVIIFINFFVSERFWNFFDLFLGQLKSE